MGEPDERIVFEQIQARTTTDELLEIYEGNKEETFELSETVKMIVRGDYDNDRLYVKITEVGRNDKTLYVNMRNYYVLIGKEDPRYWRYPHFPNGSYAKQ